MTITLSDDQQAALDAVFAWIDFGDEEDPIFTLGGLAGTGKSTLIKQIVDECGATSVCAFTGKAAHVLRNKGVPATTCHRLIYLPFEICLRSGVEISACPMCRGSFQIDLLGGAPRPTCPDTEVEFRLAPTLETSLIIVDEASMINTRLYEDLRSFGIPLLFVGDHGQLEPIGDNPGLMRDPMVKLEKIHRQAGGSEVLQFAHRVRQGFQPETTGPKATVLHSATAPRDLERFDMVLVGKNDTRVAINKMLRRIRGFEGELPQEGERVICLRNDNKRGIFNGMLATVIDVKVDEHGGGVTMTVLDDMDQLLPNLPIAPEQFNEPTTLNDIPRRKTLWDYGYCLTVHKSQGSEWKSVCVLEWIHRESSVERWRYTAATRAVEELVYCVNPRRR